jgi:hypothetical protein
MHNDKQAVPENKAAAIQEALSWHAGERDDLTLDESVEVIRHGWETVHGRSERQLVLQIAALLAQPVEGGLLKAMPALTDARIKEIADKVLSDGYDESAINMFAREIEREASGPVQIAVSEHSAAKNDSSLLSKEPNNG